MRTVLPELLAISANSPFLDGRDSGLHTARTQIFTKSFPRCGVPDAFGDWATYAEYVDFLARTGSVTEQTQIWWSVRPHHAFGTVEVRICDAQSTAEESTALAALAVACVAQAAREYDEGTLPEPPARRFIEENMWRAIRYGQDGRLIDLYTGDQFPSAATADRLLAWTAPARADQLGGLEPALPEKNGAQRQRAALAGGASMREVYEAEVALSQRSYAGEKVTT
jgi:carboxylate-amine ligase